MSCEDKLAGRTPVTVKSSSRIDESGESAEDAGQTVAKKRPFAIPIVILSVVAVVVVGLAVLSMQRHVTKKKYVEATPVLMTKPFSGTYTWLPPDQDPASPNHVFKTYIFSPNGTVIDRRSRHQDEQCSYSSDGKHVIIYHNFGMNETGVLSDDMSTFQYDKPPLVFVKQADAPMPPQSVPSVDTTGGTITEQPVVPPALH